MAQESETFARVTTTCDRCGDRYTEERPEHEAEDDRSPREDWGRISPGSVALKAMNKNPYLNRFDLCPRCVRSFANWFNAREFG